MSLESPKFELTKSRLDFYDGKPNKVDYDHQCFLARRLYEFLEPFDVYELEVDILGYQAEELFYGRPSINKAFVDLDRDYFSTYHSLTYSWLLDRDCMLESIEFPEVDMVKINRTDGTILIKGHYEDERGMTRGTYDVEPTTVADLAVQELVDMSLSTRIDGVDYYVLDLYRVAEMSGELIDKIYHIMGMSDFGHITKTLFAKSTRTKDNLLIEMGLWDIVNSRPLMVL